jgi:hypothetical protein
MLQEKAMELATVRELLTEVAQRKHFSSITTDEALNNIAKAMLHMAEAIADIQQRIQE